MSRGAVGIVAIVALLNCCGAGEKEGNWDLFDITPSEALEARVDAEMTKIDEILADPGSENILESPYLVSALYYHDGFLSEYPKEKEDADPARRIISHAVRLLSPSLKARLIQMLEQEYERPLEVDAGATLYAPVNGMTLKLRRLHRSHKHALDLFAPEGSTVRSVTRGVVLLAEGGWVKGDPLSSSSQMGGNTIIVYDPGSFRFFRYCHLATVCVAPGEMVSGGEQIGTVGHTGVNASRRGHGSHLHFEVNEYVGSSVVALNYQQLMSMLTAASSVDETEAAAGGN